jgi:hypothetical protein
MLGKTGARVNGHLKTRKSLRLPGKAMLNVVACAVWIKFLKMFAKNSLSVAEIDYVEFSGIIGCTQYVRRNSK